MAWDSHGRLFAFGHRDAVGAGDRACDATLPLAVPLQQHVWERLYGTSNSPKRRRHTPSGGGGDTPGAGFGDRDTPVAHAQSVRMASAGWQHTLVVTHSGELYSFGGGVNGQLGLGPQVTHAKRPMRVQLPQDEVRVCDRHCGSLLS
jgi:hypothetical protein